MFLTRTNKLNWSAIVIGAISTLILVFAGVFWFDIPLYNFLHRFDWGFWNVFGTLFGAKVWLVVSFLVVVVFYLRKVLKTKSRMGISNLYKMVRTSYAFWIFCSVFLASGIGGILKIIIGRMRPIFYDALNMTGFFPFTKDWAFHSMPSGHAMASFAALVTIGLLAPRAKCFTWTLAIIIGVSRVCTGMHWPSDVILGAFIGMIAADVVHAWMARRA